ncbi:MAG: 5-oxoprolinase (ATP-hydrolyzing) subunit [Nocardioidaceae bacterium]|nr:5-oxoprolinase (ATP-hydrolyzing) subunit [Nocardioidaceae bacterium]
MKIDLNADLGESWPRWTSGEDVALLDVVTSANICCGAYAGDVGLMQATCEAAVARGVSIGAQVGYPDRETFGRARFEISAADLSREVTHQIRLLDEIARSFGTQVSYVKPHGALYNRIVDDEVQARAVVDGLLGLPLMGLPRSVSLTIAEAAGIPVIHEGFADRAYTPEGRLVARTEPGAVLGDAAEVAAQAVRLLGQVASVCVHSDSPGALELARGISTALESAGAELQSATP